MSIFKRNPLVLIGERTNATIINALTENGFEVILLPADNRLAPQISHHADMLIFSLVDTVFCNKEYFEKNKSIFDHISNYGYRIYPSEFEVSNTYPKDIALNQAVIQKSIIGRIDSCSEDILNYANLHGYSYIPTKQGYAKCSSLILGEKAIISADDGIISIAKNIGLDTLKITNAIGEIVLDGYEYGFIGGASAVYENKVFFFGDPLLHSQGIDILRFCKQHNFLTISLSPEPLCDFGGAIILRDINASQQD